MIVEERKDALVHATLSASRFASKFGVAGVLENRVQQAIADGRLRWQFPQARAVVDLDDGVTAIVIPRPAFLTNRQAWLVVSVVKAAT